MAAPSGYETLMVEILARLQASGAGWISSKNVRRAHKTAIQREDSPAIHLIDGEDQPEKGSTRLECARRYGTFVVAIFVRSDAGYPVADPFKVEVMRRLNPATASYPVSVEVRPGRITASDDIADADIVRIDMAFDCKYPAPEWTL